MFAENLMQYLENDTHKYYYLTVRFGMKTYEAYLEWCKEAKEQIKEQAKVSIQEKLKEMQKQVREAEKNRDVPMRKKNMEL